MERRIMSISKEKVVQAVAQKVGPSITVEAKMEKGVWRVTLVKEGKETIFELKRGFMEDYFEKGEYQQEMAFDARINKALRGLK
jgi:enolase